MTLDGFFFAPFVGHDDMRRALVAVLALSLGAAPLGVFLMLRRMSLMGDALSHAILPGAAVGFLLAGLNVYAMALGGLAAGLLVALAAGLVARTTPLKEDASFASFFLISVAVGATLVATRGTSDDLVHFLFGDLSHVDNAAVLMIAASSTLSMLVLALIWRPLVIECVDPGFLRSISRAGAPVHILFLVLTVLNLVAAFLALGTLLAVGVMMLPAFAARFWARDITAMTAIAVALAMLTGIAGLLAAFHAGLAPAPAIILAAGAIYIGSLFFGRASGVLRRSVQRRHLEA